MEMPVGQQWGCRVKGSFAICPAPGILKSLAHAGHGQREEEQRQQQEAQHVSAEDGPVYRTLGNLDTFLSRWNHSCV